MGFNNGVPELTEIEFEQFIKSGCVLVDFYADWCMPCLMLAPAIEDLSEKLKGKMKFAKVNVEDAPDLAQRFKVSSIPNLIIFKDGKQVGQVIGGISADELENRIEKFCGQ